jgi:(2Fe-2S) ferredoxin
VCGAPSALLRGRAWRSLSGRTLSRRTYTVIVCRGPECGAKRSSRHVYDALQRVIRDYGLDDRVTMDWQSCFGRCTQGPNVLVREIVARPGGAGEPRFLLATAPQARRSHSALYNHVTETDAAELIVEHILTGGLLRRLIRSPAQRAEAASPDPEPTSKP